MLIILLGLGFPVPEASRDFTEPVNLDTTQRRLPHVWMVDALLQAGEATVLKKNIFKKLQF